MRDVLSILETPGTFMFIAGLKMALRNVIIQYAQFGILIA